MTEDGEKIWDPLRRKWLVRTPEEEVRQWFIGLLHREMKVPLPLMGSEVALKYGRGLRKKAFRADILVYDRKLAPLLVVECKQPSLKLDRNVLEQALRYNMVLEAPYIAVTNGTESRLCRLCGGKYVFQRTFPDYEEMLSQAGACGKEIEEKNGK